MQRIVIALSRQVKRHWGRTVSKTKDARLRTRYLIIPHAATLMADAKSHAWWYALRPPWIASASDMLKRARAMSSNAVRDVTLNRHYEVAASVIERQLSLIDYVGIDQFLEQGQSEGIYEDIEPGYHWRAETEYQGMDNLYLVTITVSWLEGKRPRQLSAQTMLNGAATTVVVPLEGQ